MLRRSSRFFVTVPSSPSSASSSAGSSSLVLGLARALGWKPLRVKHPLGSDEWLAERDLEYPAWREAFAELMPAHEEPLPEEPDSSRPLLGLTVAVGDDLDVASFVTRAGCGASAMHRSPKASNEFVAWLEHNGATVTGKLKCA
jgi:hypothetical protein